MLSLLSSARRLRGLSQTPYGKAGPWLPFPTSDLKAKATHYYPWVVAEFNALSTTTVMDGQSLLHSQAPSLMALLIQLLNAAAMASAILEEGTPWASSPPLQLEA